MATDVRAERWRARLLELAFVRDERVACAALEAFTHFPPEQVPYEAFARLVADETAAPRSRAAALVAASYGPCAPARPLLLGSVLDPQHPAREAALERLRELGGWLACDVLGERIEGAGDDEALREGYRLTALAIFNRYENAVSGAPEQAQWVRREVELLAWLQAHPGEVGPERLAKLRSNLAEFDWKYLAAHVELARMASEYTATPEVFPAGDVPHWSAIVRGLAAEIIVR